jgi:hypothetical protein
MAIARAYQLIIPFSESGLNSPTKRHSVIKWILKHDYKLLSRNSYHLQKHTYNEN